MSNRRTLEIEAAWLMHAHRTRYGDDRTKPGMLATLAEAQNWRCCYCGGRMEEGGKSPLRATFEHIIPRSLGGPDRKANLVVACRECNERRGCELWDEHAEAVCDGE